MLGFIVIVPSMTPRIGRSPHSSGLYISRLSWIAKKSSGISSPAMSGFSVSGIASFVFFAMVGIDSFG